MSPARSDRSKATRWGLAVALLWMSVALPLSTDFGPTWDLANGDYAYGRRILAWLLGSADSIFTKQFPIDLPTREPAPELFQKFHWYQLYPPASVLSAASAQLAYHQMGWMPPFMALHLPVFLAVGWLIVVMFRTIGSREGCGVAAVAVGLLLTSPRFLGHGLSNLKDIPETAAYFAAALAGYEALTCAPSLRRWGWFGVVAALALAQKANALFLPLQLLAFHWFAVATGSRDPSREERSVLRWSKVAIGLMVFAASYLAFSPQFWTNPLQNLQAQYRELLSVARVPHATSISFDGVAKVLYTTPWPLLVLAVVGAVGAFRAPLLRWFLLMAIAVPVLRTLIPGARNFDGVRHFLEFYPALAILAALGVRSIAGAMRERFGRVLPTTLAIVAALTPGSIGVVRTWPYLTTWYSPMLRGGLLGAREAGDPDAVDYWAGSYWQALSWLRDHAPEGATVVVPVAGHVALCAAPIRSPRLDVHGWSVDGIPQGRVLYVMYVVRPRFYGRYVRELEARGEGSVVHRIESQGAEIVRIHRFEDRSEIEANLRGFGREARAHESMQRIVSHLLVSRPELAPKLIEVLDETARVGGEATRERLALLLPEELHAVIEDVIWPLDPGPR